MTCSRTLSKQDVRMVFDKGSRILVGRKYEYVEDPKIDYAESGNSASVNKVPKGIVSGGINITVVGLNFNYIQDPKMYIDFQGERSHGPCEVSKLITYNCTTYLLHVQISRGTL